MQQKIFYFMFWSKMLSSFPSHCTKIPVLPHSPSQRAGEWGFPGSSAISLLFCSLLFICSTLQGWSPMKIPDWVILGVIKGHETTEMFCSLLRFSVLLCLEMLPIGHGTNWWIPLQMDCFPFCHNLHFYFYCNEKPPVPSPSSTECRWMALTPGLSAWHGSP